jgi:hypothetical protein
MDLATIGTFIAIAGAGGIGGVCFKLGQWTGWSENDRLKGTIDTFNAKIEGLNTKIEGLQQQIEVADRNNKFNEQRWQDAQQRAAEAEKQTQAAEAKLETLAAQKAAGASQADIDRTAVEIRSSLTKALISNTGTNAILSSGPVRLFTVNPGTAVAGVRGGYSPVTEQILFRRVTWDDVGKPTEPGTYDFSDGKISIGSGEIQVWQGHPDAILHATATASREYPQSGERPLFTPGGWDFPRDPRKMK